MILSRRLLAIALCAPAAVVTAQGESPVPDPAMLKIGASYAAKVAASAVFVSGRTIESVMAEEFAPDTALDKMLRPFLKFEVDEDERSVTARLPFLSAIAVATRGLGCVLLRDGADRQSLQARGPAVAEPPGPREWPLGELVREPASFAGIDAAAVRRAVAAAFEEPAKGPERRTRAVVVVFRGDLIAERYREGYGPATLLPGWSMTKTLVDALVGIRVRQGKLELDAELATPDWPAADPRRALRLQDLLGMHSGLAWSESYTDPGSDCLRMLFGSSDHASVQARNELEAEPRSRWLYSSGTTNLICRELRASFEGDGGDDAYWAFPRRELFTPLGIQRGLIECDPSGTFVGSSYGFLTARDWARIGMLYEQDGTFAGRRILPAGWVARAATPVPASGGRYGSQIWLNADPDGDGPVQARWPELPTDLMRLDGHEGQYVVIVPSADLVIARLGCTKATDAGVRELAAAVFAAIDR